MNIKLKNIIYGISLSLAIGLTAGIKIGLYVNKDIPLGIVTIVPGTNKVTQATWVVKSYDK
jgi:hypothetical protein